MLKYGEPQDRTPGQKGDLELRLETLVQEMQDAAEDADSRGEADVFTILDSAAYRLRNLYQ